MKQRITFLYSYFVRILLFLLPDITIFMRFRGWLYGFGMKKCGKDIQVAHNVIFQRLEKMSLGSHIYFGTGVIQLGGGELTIEDEVPIGPHCIIVSGNHTRLNRSFFYGKGVRDNIKICKGSWVAGNCTITKGSVLPAGSVLAANSVLNKVFSEEDCVYGGCPAKLLKHYNSNE